MDLDLNFGDTQGTGLSLNTGDSTWNSNTGHFNSSWALGKLPGQLHFPPATLFSKMKMSK
jgi:hypothetical protein